MKYFIIEKYFNIEPFMFLSNNYKTKTFNKEHALCFDDSVEAYRTCLLLEEIRPNKTYEVLVLEEEQEDQDNKMLP